jgi:hypothetical protein
MKDKKRGGYGAASLIKFMVRPARLERATFGFVDRRSIQLSYGRLFLSKAKERI